MKKVLILTGMQKGLICSDNSFVKYIKEMLEEQQFDYVFATKLINFDGSILEERLEYTRLKSKEEIEICDELKELVDEEINIFPYSFVNEGFMIKLGEISDTEFFPEEICICGLGTDTFVLKNALDLFEYGIDIKVITNYCKSTHGVESNIAALKVLSKVIGDKRLINWYK